MTEKDSSEKTTENSILLSVYAYAYEKASSNQSFSYNDIAAYISKNKQYGISVKDPGFVVGENRSYFEDAIHSIFGQSLTQNDLAIKKYMKPQAFFQYVDYMELRQAQKESKEARKAANKAQNTANWALGLAIVIGLVQITIALAQLCFDINVAK